jgi:hypothetical protein
MEIKLEQYTKTFGEEGTPKAEEIDPSNEHDWHSLVLGWALGKGLGPDQATEVALDITYHTDLA